MQLDLLPCVAKRKTKRERKICGEGVAGRRNRSAEGVQRDAKRVQWMTEHAKWKAKRLQWDAENVQWLSEHAKWKAERVQWCAKRAK
jgi:hypothetical protein